MRRIVSSACIVLVSGCAGLTPYPDDDVQSGVAPPAIAQYIRRTGLVTGLLEGGSGGRAMLEQACAQTSRIPFRRIAIATSDLGVEFALYRIATDKRGRFILGVRIPTAPPHHRLVDPFDSTIILIYEANGRAREIAQGLIGDITLTNLGDPATPGAATTFVVIVNSANPAMAFVAKERATSPCEGIIALAHDTQQAKRFLMMRVGSARRSSSAQR